MKLLGPVAPKLIVLAGLPGVGKSSIARVLAARLEATWLRVDRIEAALLRAGLAPSFETGLAAYLAANDLASEHLQLGRTVIVDAVNGVEPAREMWRALALRWAVPLRVVEITCSDPAEHRRRVESRAPGTPPLRTPSWDEVVRREYRPWEESILSLDGIDPVAKNVERIVAYCT